jgi:hypothetical protein
MYPFKVSEKGIERGTALAVNFFYEINQAGSSSQNK